MNNQNLLIYESDELHNILNELTTNSNLKVIKLTKNEILNANLNDYDDYLILTLDKNFNKLKQTLYIESLLNFLN